MNTPVSRPLIVVGVLQGIALWGLWQATDTKSWPATDPEWMNCLLWLAGTVPLAIYFSSGASIPFRTRAALVGALGIAYALLGFYAGWVNKPLFPDENIMPLPGRAGVLMQGLAASAAGFIAILLVAGRDRDRHGWNYHQLFELAWRNVLLAASVFAITGLFWGVLYAGAMLMHSIGVDFIKDLIQRPAFGFTFTGMVVGAAFANGISRAGLLVNIRRYWLALNAWLLPLLLMFSIMWLFALPFTGLALLFKTHAAAFMLLWFLVLAINFINCAWQSGGEAVIYPSWLQGFIRLAWLTLVPVSITAALALGQRIQQHGLTEDRIWAALICLLSALHVAGYALSNLPRLNARGWMASISSTNIGVSIVTLVSLALLASPVADPRRLAVNNQLARLQAGQVKPADFDYVFLRFSAGRWGTDALRQLTQQGGDAANRAKLALAQKSPYDDNNAETLTNADIRAHLQTLGNAQADDAILTALRARNVYWQIKSCLDANAHCALWMHDFDGDGRNDALLLVETRWGNVPRTEGIVLAQGQQGWGVAASIHGGLSIADWKTAIDNNAVTLKLPRWPDVTAAGTTMHMAVEDSEAFH